MIKDSLVYHIFNQHTVLKFSIPFLGILLDVSLQPFYFFLLLKISLLRLFLLPFLHLKNVGWGFSFFLCPKRPRAYLHHSLSTLLSIILSLVESAFHHIPTSFIIIIIIILEIFYYYLSIIKYFSKKLFIFYKV